MQPTTITATTNRMKPQLRSKNKNKFLGKIFWAKIKQNKKKTKKNETEKEREKTLREDAFFFSFLPFVGPLVGCV